MRVPRPSRSEQKKQIEDIVLLKQHVAVGDTWYIISKKWFQDWEDFVQGGDNNHNDGDNNHNDDDNDKEPPGPIDNSMLISEDNTLKRGLVEYGDYELIAEDAWNLLHQWYSGGPSMGRRAIQLRTRSHILVEVRPLALTVCHPRHPDSLLHCSKGDTIGSIKQQICTLWNLNAASMEVWDAAGVLVEDMDKQLAELYVADGQKITVTDTRMTMADVSPKAAEEDSSQSTSEISTYPSSSYSSYPSSSSSSYSSSSSSSSSYTSSYSYSSYYDQKPKQPPPPPGIVGLNNLGNTCFMNSSLQCMSNTVPLTEFFLSGAYEKDINLENPLGTQGKLVEEFARLIKELWNGRHSAVAPRDFKSRLERFASQFTGYQQHDSQELLAFLLDGLHEDLNRVKKKVYASAREGDDIPDVERAKEAWEIHKNRNDSVIVDWFQAALKSTLVCPTCGKVSVTFDPFMYLSLPLPMKVDRSVPLTLVTLDAAQPPTKYLVKVPKIGTIATLKAKLAEMAGVSADCLILTDVFNCKFFKKFNDSESIDSFDEERDVLYAYQVKPQPPPRERDSSDNDNDNDSDNDEDNKLVHCAVYNRKDEARNPHYPHLTPGTHLFGSPFFVSVAPNITYRALYQLLKASVQRWIKNPDTLNPDILNPDQNTESVDATETQGEESQRLSSDDESASRLFTIQTVDNHGYHENPLNDNDAPLQLDNKTTLAIHWKPEALPFLEDSKFSVNHSSMSTGDPSDPSGITLDKCMSLYTTTERLGPDDPWYCNRCKEHKQATKKFDLWSAPRILVVHLKRFSYRNKYFREKLETLVTCPLKGFDLSAHIIGPSDYSPIYDLYAVSNHYGSLGGGHYTAYALNKSTNKWYTFDDSHVTEMDESQVISPHAYVLFYRRRDTLALSSVPASLQTPTDNRESASGLQKSDDTMEENTPIQTSMDLD